MITHDETKLGALYENMGNYPSGMTSRDMDHVEGKGQDVDVDSLEWNIVDIDEENIDGKGSNLVFITADEGSYNYTAKAITPFPFRGKFLDIKDVEREYSDS